uniref:Uncharacterized protein LOC111111608 n=1 Tax=Crassostrea virginica TaxID=6565 RepID=A0A8B8BM34_CRAVI|nr:uncharacterized protein LOC111111608 [Crassostrea virginica]
MVNIPGILRHCECTLRHISPVIRKDMASLDLLHCPGCNSLFLTENHFQQHRCFSNSPVQPLVFKDNMTTLYRESVPSQGKGAACQLNADKETNYLDEGNETDTESYSYDPQPSMSEIKQNWTSDLTKALIIFRGELDAEFASKKKTHKSLWKQISEKLKMELDFSGDWLQCQSKFNKLTAKYKAVEDANKKSGERRRTMEFHSEMMVVMGDDPKITPLKTVSVGVGKGVSVMCSAKGVCKPIEESEKSQSTSKSAEVACEKVKKVCKRKRQDELVDLLLEARDERRKFQEEQMKVNERKIALMERLVSLFEK